MLISLGVGRQVVIEDASGTTELGRVNLPQTANFLVAPTRAAGPAVGITIGVPSRLWFIDPASASLVDSLDINDQVISTAITSDGKKLFAMQSDGQLAVVDGQTHQLITKVVLGGGVTKILVAPGDTTLYATTNVGVLFDIDARTNTVRRQIPATLAAVDFVIGPDNTFYLLDPAHSVVNSYDINQRAVIRVTSVAASATTIAITPDGKQIWLTHTNPAQVTQYLGDNTIGFGFGGAIQTSNSVPSRAYVSPIGSFVAVANPGGWVDIIR
jgi:hypothetical protein